MNTWRKLLSTVAAIGVAAGIAWGANVPLTPGPLEPNQLQAIINGLTQNINQNVSGVIASFTVSTPIGASSTETNIWSTTVPGNTLTSAGQSVQLRCSGTTGNDTNSKIVRVYFGSSSYTSPSISQAAANWDIELLVTYVGTQSQNIIGRGWSMPTASSQTVVVFPVVATNVTTDIMASNLAARCTGMTIAGTLPNEVTGVQFIVETKK